MKKMIDYKTTRMIFVEFDVVGLAEIDEFSTSEQDPERFSTQWSEVFKGDRVLFGETLRGLMFKDWEFISVV